VILPPRRCSFCNHANPEGAKFCNDCGWPLHLKRCSQCEAINNQAAKTCAECGAEFSAQTTPSEGATNVPSPGHYARFGSTHKFGARRSDLDSHLDESPNPTPSAAKVSAAAQASVASKPALENRGSSAQPLARPAAATEREKRSLPFEPRRSTFENPAPSIHVGSNRERVPEPVRADDIEDVHRRRPARETPETRDSGPKPATREPRSSVGDVISPYPAIRGANEMIPSATPERPPMSRVTRAVLLPTITLIAIGVSVYYIYGQSPHLGEGKGARTVSTSPVDVNAGDPPTRSIPKIGVTAPSAPSAPLGTGSVAAIETAKGAPPIESSTTVPTSPASPSEAAATGSDDASSQTPLLHQPSPGAAHPKASTSAMPTASNEVAAKQSRTNRPMHMYPDASAPVSAQSLLGDSRVKVRPEVPRPSACTEAVAALGLCSPSSTGESK